MIERGEETLEAFINSLAKKGIKVEGWMPLPPPQPPPLRSIQITTRKPKKLWDDMFGVFGLERRTPRKQGE